MFDFRKTFDTVKAHLLKQHEKSAVLRGAETGEEIAECRYRYDEKMCAIGALIPDEKYNSRMEGKCASGLLADFGPVIPGTEGMFEVHKDRDVFSGSRRHWTEEEQTIARYLDALQSIHDECDVDDWEETLQSVENALFGTGAEPTDWIHASGWTKGEVVQIRQAIARQENGR